MLASLEAGPIDTGAEARLAMWREVGGGASATPSPAPATPPSAAKSPFPLYAVLAAGVMVLGAAAFFLWPKGAKPTTAQPVVRPTPAVARAAATPDPAAGGSVPTLPPASTSPGTAPSRGGGWEPLCPAAEWQALRDEKREFKDGLLQLRGTSLYHAAAKADGAVRARIRITEQTNIPAVVGRSPSAGGQYKLTLLGKGREVELSRTRVDATRQVESLARSPLPQPPALGETLLLELRIQGDRLTGLVNGAVVVEAQDALIRNPGYWGVFGQPGAFESAEVQFDEQNPGTAPAISSSAATKDAPFVNSLGMKFVPVPITGGPTDGQRVLFSIWETRVQDYELFATETKREWPKADFPQGPTHPAVGVTWEDAQAFCTWLTERERKAGKLGAIERYRLPSDHEWSCAVGIGEREDAAQTPADKDQKIADVFPWGAQWPPPAGAGNYAGEESRAEVEARDKHLKSFVVGYQDGYVRTAPTGSFAANRLGLYDLGGNGGEFCEDWFDGQQNERVVRGATWGSSNRTSLLSSKRPHVIPTIRGESNGFRVVLAPAR